MVSFKKRIIDRGNNFESAAYFDINNDGKPEIVCGQYWYENPDFLTRHQILDLLPIGGAAYQDDFSDYPMDVNGNGWMDMITGSYFNPNLRWRENPGENGKLWAEHDICVRGAIETIRYYDIDGCGTAEIFPNNPDTPACFVKLIKDENGKGTGKFKVHELNPAAQPHMGHGIGFGDINGDGLVDLITVRGWFENPGDIYGEWIFHDDFNFPKLVSPDPDNEEITNSIGDLTTPCLVMDVNGDGLNDIICSRAHHDGLYWMEQKLDADGKRSWIKHVIDADHSQYHDMQLADVDLDGEMEIVTGKRWMAHCGNDPGDKDDPFVYIYKNVNGTFERTVLDEGPPFEDHSGTGIYFWVADVTGNGYPDIIAPGKEGLFLFENQGK